MIVVVMGVTGTGKSTVGEMLAAKLGWQFGEGDAYHPQANVDKMHAGIPLNDEDRAPWLARLHAQMLAWDTAGSDAVLTCSALKQQYRDALVGDLPPGRVHFVLLEASKETIEKRLANRKGHFMSPALLDSQLAILEVPQDAWRVSVEGSAETAVAGIVQYIAQAG